MPMKIELPKLSVGERFKDKKTGVEYRILCMCDGITTTCVVEKKVSSLIIKEFSTRELIMKLLSEDITKVLEEHNGIEITLLSQKEQQKYNERLRLVTELQRIYGPTWKGFSGKCKKPEYEEICKKYGLSKRAIRTIVNSYIQSGCDKSCSIVFCKRIES